MKKFIFILFILIFNFSFSEEYIKGKITKEIEVSSQEKNIIKKEMFDEELKDIIFYEVKIKNDTIRVEQPIYEENSLNLDLKVGDKILLVKDTDEDGSDIYFITDKDKKGNYFAISLIFISLTLLIAKLKGFKGLISLGISVVSIFYFFLPLVIKGYSPILLSIITAIFSAIVTIYFIAGFSKKGIVAILGSVGGVVFSGIISFYFVKSMRLTGLSTVDAVGYSKMLQGIKIKELISAGIIIGSMGAIMDVAMSISSAITEIVEANPKIKPYKLFISGINIGKDIIGTMINTLILAYIGGSLFDILVIALNIDELTFTRLFNFEFIAVEILRSFAGSIGILIAVPLTAYLGSYSKKYFHK